MPGSKRKAAVDGMVTTLQTVTTGNGYQFDLSGTGVVSTAIETRDSVFSGGRRIAVRVRDGEERISRTHLARGYEARVGIVVEVLYQVESTSSMVAELNALLLDIRTAIDSHQDLSTSGQIVEGEIQSISAPAYDFEDRTAAVVIFVDALYTYTAGQAGGL